MKPSLVIILGGLLCLACSAQAENEASRRYVLEWTGDPQNAVHRWSEPTLCERQMEAAMRAMEPYLGPFGRFSYHDGGWWLERKLELASPPLFGKLVDAGKLWETAKLECWRKP